MNPNAIYIDDAIGIGCSVLENIHMKPVPYFDVLCLLMDWTNTCYFLLSVCVMREMFYMCVRVQYSPCR